MKIKNQAIVLSVFALLFASCSEDNWIGGKGHGGIDLKLTASAEVTDALPIMRSGGPELVAPDASDFAIELLNLDTEMANTWQSLEDFHKEEGFDVGSYKLTAFYGDENECGFDKPYFKGEATLSVLEGRESSVEVTAQLANVMLSVEYTEAFKNYFPDYSVIAHTDGHANVTFHKTETRAGFMPAGDVTLQVSLKNPSGKTATLTPAQFPAQARHHYHVKFDVNADPLGVATLQVVFDDSVEKENVEFNLSDELFNADAPVVAAEGFTSGQPVEALSGSPAPDQLKFDVECKGGIQKAILKIAQLSGTQQFNPPFAKELDLVTADESVQNLLEQYGIKVAGLFKNPQQYAVVDVTNLPKYLPSGTFELTLTVTDVLGRDNEQPVTLNLSTAPISLSFVSGSAVYVYPGDGVTVKPTVDATVTVSYNGMSPETCISFQNLCRMGIYKDCDIIECKESTRTRGFVDKIYIFKIKVCDVENSPLPMKLFFNGNEYGQFKLDVIEPNYSLIADAFANYARFKVETDNEEDTPTIVNGLTLYQNGTALDKSRLETDPEKGLITVSGLEPDKDYTIGYSLTTRPDGLPEDKTVKIHTEAEAQVPNGNFSATQQTINWNPIDAGGQYKYGTTTMQNHSSIVINTPTSWATLNPLTCYTGANVKNTWFCVPSTLMENNAVVIRTVAYDHNGKLPDLDNHGLSVRAKYSRNKPASFASKASGELFLGTYTYNGTASRKDGVAFTSRPSSLTFSYSYAPVSGEVGQVYIALVDAAGAVISETRADIKSGSDKEMTLPLPDYPFGKKAASIRLSFKSSKSVINVPVPDDIQDVTNTTGLGGQTIAANQYKSLCVGSKLTLKKVELNY